MALINHRAREIHFKIVYYGPSLGGKTTNLRMLHERLPADRRGRLLSIATDHERTLFFDFLPFALGQVHGYTIRIHLYTTPGQSYYRLSRRAVLQGVDGLVFVADSHPARESANRESLLDLEQHLGVLGVSPEQRTKIGWVLQYNKRDVPGALSLERMRRALNPGGALEFEAVAAEGRGVAETMRAACKSVLAQVAATGIAPPPEPWRVRAEPPPAASPGLAAGRIPWAPPHPAGSVHPHAPAPPAAGGMRGPRPVPSPPAGPALPAGAGIERPSTTSRMR